MALTPIRVAPSGRYFETTDNQPFLFIGANDAVSWPGLAGLYRRKDLDAVDAHLAALSASGVTILRLMLEYCHTEGRYFERPAGRFNPAMVRLWDDLFARCEAFSIRVLLAPWDNFWMARRWHKHPYNRANGGPAEGPGSFFTDEAVVAATIERFRFVINRWGGSGVIGAWDLFNEIHPYWGGTAQEQSDVLARLSDAVREAETSAWGFTRPQTVSIFGPEPPAEYEEMIFRHPSLDFTSTHIYQGAIDYPRNTVTPAALMGRWVRHALERVPPDRPYTDTEHGPIHLFNDHRVTLPEDFDDEYERHMMWAHLASGGAGSGLRWPARHPHVLTPGMRRALASLAEFSGLVDWRSFRSRNAGADVSVSARGVLHFACRDAEQAVVWLLRGSPERNPPGLVPSREALTGATLCVQGMRPGRYCCEFWDTAAGVSVGCRVAEASAAGVLLCPLPPFQSDLAIAVQHAPEGAACREGTSH